MKILIVESGRELAKAITCESREVLFEVHYAADGASGLQDALEGQFDLIVLDWTLPGKTGLSLLKSIRKQGNLTPILMLTAQGSTRDVIQSLDCGADSCLTVPFEIPVLIARMRALMRRSQWDRSSELSRVTPHLAA